MKNTKEKANKIPRNLNGVKEVKPKDLNPFAELRTLKGTLPKAPPKKSEPRLSPYTRKIKSLETLHVTQMTSEYKLGIQAVDSHREWLKSYNFTDCLVGDYPSDLPIEQIVFFQNVTEGVINKLYPILALKIRHFVHQLGRLADPNITEQERWIGMKNTRPAIWKMFKSYISDSITINISRKGIILLKVNHFVIKMTEGMLDSAIKSTPVIPKDDFKKLLLDKLPEKARERSTYNGGQWIDIYTEINGQYPCIGVIISTNKKVHIEKYRKPKKKKTSLVKPRAKTVRNIVSR